MVFIARNVPDAQFVPLLRSCRDKPVLLVGETEDFVAHGGTIGFVLVNKSVRFDINLGQAGQAGLKISSKLLTVARTVLKSP